MNKKKWLRIRIEILLVAGVLLILLTIMIPRFLGAQRIARAKHLQRFINAVMLELVKDDAAIAKQIGEGKTFIEDNGRFNFRFGEIESSPGHPFTGTSTIYYLIRKSSFKELLDVASLPYLADDIQYGEQEFCLYLKYLREGNEKQLAFFGLYAKLYNHNQSSPPSRFRSVPSRLISIKPGFPISVDTENCFQPVRQSYPLHLYNPSNGIESDGIVFRDSYQAGWRVRAGTGPVIDHLK